MIGYTVRLDPASVAKLRKLMEMAPAFRVYMQAAMTASVAEVERQAKLRAPVGSQGGSGRLRRAIVPGIVTPTLGEVGVERSIPYGLRRELGFTGRWDTHRKGSLAGQPWRYYARDPGAYYMRDGLIASLPFIAMAFKTATTLTIRTVTLLP